MPQKKPKTYKVYCVCYDGRNRVYVAANSRKKAAEITGLSYSFFSQYGSQTFNKEVCEMCLANPEKPFRRSAHAYGIEPYKEYIKGERNAD